MPTVNVCLCSIYTIKHVCFLSTVLLHSISNTCDIVVLVISVFVCAPGVVKCYTIHIFLLFFMSYTFVNVFYCSDNCILVIWHYQ